MKKIYHLLMLAFFAGAISGLRASTPYPVHLTQDSVIVAYMRAANASVIWGITEGFNSALPDTVLTKEIVRSTDGGITWTDIVTNIPDSLYLDNMIAIDSQTCWLALVYGYGSGIIFKTSDGGVTWQQQNPEAYHGSYLDFVYFFNADSGLSVGDADVDGYFDIWTTSDGGNTWTPVPLANMPPALYADETAFSGNFSFNQGIFYFPTESHRLFKTADMGKTWTADTLTGFIAQSQLLMNRTGTMLQLSTQFDSLSYLYSYNYDQTVQTGMPADSGVYQGGNEYTNSNTGSDFFDVGTNADTSDSTGEQTLLRSATDLSQPWQVVDSSAGDWLFQAYYGVRTFYSNNMGWLPGSTVDSNHIQQIYKFTDCSYLTVSLTGLPDTICNNASTIQLNQGNPAGGFYLVNGRADSVFNPLTVLPGTVTIDYKYQDSAGCSSSTQGAITVVTCTGIAEVTANSFTLYPNPASDHLVIQSDLLLAKVNPEVYDATGRIIQLAFTQSANTLTFNTSQLAPGFYWIKLTFNGQTTGLKFIKIVNRE
jgi:hypothetical protein